MKMVKKDSKEQVSSFLYAQAMNLVSKTPDNLVFNQNGEFNPQQKFLGNRSFLKFPPQ